MTLRERIADWISGGALTRARYDCAVSDADVSAMSVIVDKHSKRLNEARVRFDRIAAEETPKANATVKRMAAIARGER